MSFLRFMFQNEPPLILGKLFGLTLHHSYPSFEALSTFFKVTRVITLATPCPPSILGVEGMHSIQTPPHESHPYHSSERRYLPSWRYYGSKLATPLPCAL